MSTGPDRSSPGLGRLARGGALNLAGSLWSALAQFALVGVVARRVDEAMTGAFFVVMSIVVLAAAVPNLGAATGLTYFLSRHRAAEAWHRIRPTLRTGLWPVTIASVAVALVLALIAGPVAEVSGLGTVEGATTAIRVGALAAAATAIVTTLTAALRGLGNLRATVLYLQVVQPTLQLLLVALLATSGLVALTVGWSAPIVLTALACFAVLVRWLRGRARAAAPDTEAAAVATNDGTGRRFWRYASPLAVVELLKIVVQRIDIILLSALRSPSEVALYVAASRYLVLGQVVNRAMNWTVQPRIARALAAGDRTGVRDAYGAVTAWLVLASWPVSLGCLVFPGALLEVVGGPAYRAGTAALLVLSATMLVAAACGNVESVLAMAGRSRINLAVTLTATAVNVALLFVLIPAWGVVGAALAWAAAVLASNVVPLVALARLEHLTPFGRPVVVAMLISLLSTAAVGSVVRVVVGDTLTALLVAVPLCGLTHVGLVALRRRDLGLARAVGAAA